MIHGDGDPEGSSKLPKQYLSFDSWKAVVRNQDIERLGLDWTAMPRQQLDRRIIATLKESKRPNTPVPGRTLCANMRTKHAYPGTKR
jgi:hypothetical protein